MINFALADICNITMIAPMCLGLCVYPDSRVRICSGGSTVQAIPHESCKYYLFSIEILGEGFGDFMRQSSSENKI